MNDRNMPGSINAAGTGPSPGKRRRLLAGMATSALLPASLLTSFAPGQAHASGKRFTLDDVLEQAASLKPLETVLVSRNGHVIADRGYRGHASTVPGNIKSASKLIMSAMVGIAIDKGVLEGTEQGIAELLEDQLPANPDPRIYQISIGHLLSMQAGLGSTSGVNYSAWVASPNWVRAALARPFEDDPGGAMIYSTGSTHLLSAILTRQTGRSMMELAQDWLGPLEGFSIDAWVRDPQGIYMGGNEMAMSPRSLLAFGEMYRNGGRTSSGQHLITQEWIDASWQYRTQSPWTGDGYGYAWFLTGLMGEPLRYGWGYGGQMLYIAPESGLTVVMTSDVNLPSGSSGHRSDLHALMGRIMAAMPQT